MAVPDGGEALSLWQQAWAGLALFSVTVLSQAWRYFASLKEKEPPSHVVLEQADIADMRPLRELSAQMEREFPKLRDDLSEVRVLLHKIDDTVERLDQERELQRRLADERLRDHMAQLHREERDRGR